AVGDDPETPPEVCRWLRSLPELLCRWGGEFPRDSEAVLGVLVELLRSIEPALLVEFFGDQGFLLLPAAAQRNAISFLYHLPSIPVKVVCELAAACSEPTALNKDVRSFVLEV
ncbi:unnamed protein product, partial [Ectocarpus sp. 8 AP-2014]